MNVYKFPLQRLSPCGILVNIEVEAKLILPSLAKFDIRHDGKLIGNIVCEVGNMQVFDATDFVIDGYFKSEEFKAFRKEAGKWN